MLTSSSSIMRRAARHSSSIDLAEALLAAGGAEEDGQRADLEAGQVQAPDLGEFLVGENRPFQLERGGNRPVAAAAGCLRSRATSPTTMISSSRMQSIGRVRHLREELLEVVVEQSRPVRQHRQRRVVAHRADRLDAVARHRLEQ